MLKNEDMKQEFALFGDVWKMLKALLPVGTKDDTDYWDEAVRQVTEIRHKYPGEFGKALAFSVLDELERRCKVNEDQDTGRKAVS